MKSKIIFLTGGICAGFLSFSEPIVDRYGQFTDQNWPGKITEDFQLRLEAEREAAELAGTSRRDSEKFDRYGGFRDGKNYGATGWFRLQKIDDRWWFITPEGNRFFLKGIDAINPFERGYSTPLYQRDGSMRPELTLLPDFPEAVLNGKLSYLIANLNRKYGSQWRTRWKEVAVQRLFSWGFNAASKWNWGEKLPGVPYIEDSRAGAVQRIGWAIDFYHPDFSKIVEASIKKVCDRCRDDKFLIGYSMENENGWSEEAVALFLRQTQQCYAKEAFLDFLQKRGISPADAFNMPGRDRTALLSTALSLPDELLPEVTEFIHISSEQYHEIVAGFFKKYDPNHLFLGAAHCLKQSAAWYLGAAKYVDFLAFNIYGLNLGWLNHKMENLRKLDKPFAILEYSFVVEDRGYTAYSGNNTMRNWKDRGTGFRLFTEQTAAEPLCIGFGYFIYWDQPVTRRSLPHGEAFAFGLVNQQDQPYTEMLTQVKKANSRLEWLHAGKDTPFILENPRQLIGWKNSCKFQNLFLPGSQSPEVILDPSGPHKFNGENARLKIDESIAFKPGTYYIGTVGCGEGQIFTGFRLGVFLWKKSEDQNPARHFEVAESPDNQHFTPILLQVEKLSECEFNSYELSNAVSLKSDTKFLRFGINVKIPGQSWAAQIATVKLEK